MDTSIDELNDLFALGKAELIRANQDRRHPFRNLTLATKGEYPGVRTVVKRRTMADLVTLIYTDSRTLKVEQMSKDPNCSQLYYHPKKKLQIIILGQCNLITEGTLFLEHQEVALKNKDDYSAVIAPGSSIDLPTYNTSDRDYFMLLEIQPLVMEILKLEKPYHKRARFLAEEDWSGTWLVP